MAPVRMVGHFGLTLAEFWNGEDVSTPSLVGGRFFFGQKILQLMKMAMKMVTIVTFKIWESPKI